MFLDSSPQIYAIIDDQFLYGKTPVEIARVYLESEIKIIQLRCKNLDPQDFFFHAKEIMKLKSEFEFTFIINDDVDICKLVEADGVHLGQGDKSIEEAREILGKNKVIGLSTHDLDQVKISNQLSLNYIGFGPIFKTSSKKNIESEVGIENLSRAIQISKYPLVAIGGINEENFISVIEKKPQAVALISALSKLGQFKEQCAFFRNKTGYQ